MKWMSRIRNWALNFYWIPTMEEMRRVAAHYGFEVQTAPLPIFARPTMAPIYVRVGGYLSMRGRLIVVRNDDYRVFWHEIGHIHRLQRLANWIRSSLMYSIPTLVALSIAGYCGGEWIGVALGSFILFTIANELVAHFLVGLLRSKEWKGRFQK
jgi:hypothetical protein